jgi:hypothetical protein
VLRKKDINGVFMGSKYPLLLSITDNKSFIVADDTVNSTDNIRGIVANVRKFRHGCLLPTDNKRVVSAQLCDDRMPFLACLIGGEDDSEVIIANYKTQEVLMRQPANQERLSCA